MTRAIRLLQSLVDLLTSARFVVDGDSMLPALADKEWVLAVRPRFPWNRLRRGDVVVVKHPVWVKRTYLKRIVGLPNEEIRLQGGRVYVDGSLLEERYLSPCGGDGGSDSRDWWTGSEEFFVLGDNRGDSQDSRAFGPVARQLIMGRVWLRCWPRRAWGRIDPGGGPSSTGRG